MIVATWLWKRAKMLWKVCLKARKQAQGGFWFDTYYFGIDWVPEVYCDL
jgi:hypothetical protein